MSIHGQLSAPRSRLTFSLLSSVALIACLAGCSPTKANQRGDGDGGTTGGIIPGNDPNVDHDGDGYTVNQGDCNDQNASIYPGAPELCNGVDDNCNGKIDEVCDYDGDSYTPNSGDCNDQEKLVNPGAYEVVGNNVDDNCNGLTDEVTPPCDSSQNRDGLSMAGQMELCVPWVQTATLNTDSDPSARGVFATYGAIAPKLGKGFIVLSTGIAAAETNANFVAPQPGTQFQNDDPNPLPMNQKNNVCGTPSADEETVHDYVEYKLTLKVPTNAQSFSFNFFFMTSEYPEWVGSEFNDKFLAILDSQAFQGNISFDQNNNPITVNVGFFNVCDSAPICNNTLTNSCKVNTLSELNGTGYELDDGTGTPIGGGTGWLTTTAPVKPGEIATLRFVIFDEGDHILDSAVVIDNFQWQLEAANGPTTIQ